MRRAIGVGGAAAVALGAAMALALPASAHVQNITPSCNDDGTASVTIQLSQYSAGHKHKMNTVTLNEDDTVLLKTTPFGKDFTQTFDGLDGTVTHHFVMTVTSIDGIGAGKFKAYSPTCPQPTSSTTTTTTTEVPPSSTTSEVPPTSTTAPATTTSEAVVAATSTTPAPPGSQQLAFTGVNTALPIGIAALLVIAGGGILFWLRFNARRKTS